MMKREISHKLILVVLPLTLPGCGKSSLIGLSCSKLSSESCLCSVISSEAIRVEALKKYSAMPLEFAHKKSTPDYNKEFNNQLSKLLCNIESLLNTPLEDPKMVHVIFFDKNHPPDALGKSIMYFFAIFRLCKNMKIPKNTILKIGGLYPQCKTHIKDKVSEFPFSYSYLISSTLKGLKKKDASGTLLGKPMGHILAVTVKFVKLFLGFSFKKDFMKHFGVDELIEYFSEPEPEEGVITEEIKKGIISIMSYTTKGLLIINHRLYMQ